VKAENQGIFGVGTVRNGSGTEDAVEEKAMNSMGYGAPERT